MLNKHHLNLYQMHKPNCNIRKLCGDRRSRYALLASPDNPYIGGDYPSDNIINPDEVTEATLIQWVAGDLFSATDLDPIAVWEDFTAFNNDYTQGNAAQRPIYRENILNGKPVLRFDGTNDGMTSTLSYTAPFTVFVVYSYRSAVSATRRAITGSLNWLIGPYNNKHQLFSGAVFIEGPAVVENEFVTACAVQVLSPAQLVTFYVNGTLIDSVFPATEPDDARIAASGVFSEPLNGDIAEILIYDGALTTSLVGVHNYLQNKYQHY